jgi:hypothetical protein
MLPLLSHRGRTISLIGGFLFATLGALWSFLVVERLSEQARALANAKADVQREIQSLNTLASEYFIANQQGDLIFILAQQENARRDLASLIHKGNVLDRATPVRNMIGALAVARQLDYRSTYDAYEKLNNETRANLSFENFTRLKQEEKNIIVKGQERVPLLLDQLFEIEPEINANEAAQKKQRILCLVASILGSSLLLLPTLPLKRSPNEISSRGLRRGQLSDWPQKPDAAAKFSAPEASAFTD